MRFPHFIFLALTASNVKAEVTRLEPGSPLPYLFQIPGNAAIATIFLILALSHFYLLAKSKAKWTMCLPLAEVTSGVGYILRIVCRSNQQSLALYAVENLLVILSPAAFLAFNYMLYSRLIVAIDDDIRVDSKRTTRSRFSILPPRLFGRIFVWSDVITFLIQAAGGGIQATGSNTSLGNYIFLVGVTLQAVSYLIFLLLVMHSHSRIGFHSNFLGVSTLFGALYFSSIFILVRCVYRIIEMAAGYNGIFYRHEIYTFLLDALPLILAIAVWTVVWPPTYITQAASGREAPYIRTSLSDDPSEKEHIDSHA